MSGSRYIMRDQAAHKIRDIMAERPLEPPLLPRPSWVALLLLLAAFNLMAVVS